MLTDDLDLSTLQDADSAKKTEKNRFAVRRKKLPGDALSLEIVTQGNGPLFFLVFFAALGALSAGLVFSLGIIKMVQLLLGTN